MKANLPETLTAKLKALPKQPGCYIFRDDAGEVLYIGKAVSLRNRVRSYFQASTRHSMRIARMVSKVRDVEWMVVTGELEALVLECNLIKEHRPPYNVRLRDDKSYPYIVITKEKFPRVLFTRRRREDGSRYFGPYASAFAVRDTLRLLHKIFPLIPCGKSWDGTRQQKPCLYYHLGQCLAPCAGLADRKQYEETLDRVREFLTGKTSTIVDGYRREMEEASENLEFERAAVIRDRIQAIESVLEKQKVLAGEHVDQDVIAVVKNDRGAAIQMLFVRSGRLIGQRQFILDGSSEADPGLAVQEFVKQYYAESPDVPSEVLLPVEIAERAIIQQWLRSRRGSAVKVEVPQHGDKLGLVDLAASNAEQALRTMALEVQQKEAWAEEAMAELAEALDLPDLPIRIEGYDISNTQGSLPVGSMVVATNGEPDKNEYRRFRIKWNPESPNDFAMMHEVLTRRLRAYLDKRERFTKLPDLIMIDGGKGQLSAAMAARDALGLTVPMVGLAKKSEILFLPNRDYRPTGNRPELPDDANFREVVLPMNSPSLLLLRKLRDEAHRFALSYHRKLRDQTVSRSVIEEVPGVGPRRKRLLLRTFGSVEGIRRATVEQIAAVPTMTERLARQVKDYLNDPGL